MGHQLGAQHAYRLVRQHSNDGLTDRSFHVVPPHSGRGWGLALSSPSSPVHSALQPAYSSPRVYGSAANIYAEVETDTEIDSGFTEESVSQEGDKSLYTAISQHGLSSAGQLTALGYTMDSQGARFVSAPSQQSLRGVPHISRPGQGQDTILAERNGKIFSISRGLHSTGPKSGSRDTRRRPREKHDQIHV